VTAVVGLLQIGAAFPGLAYLPYSAGVLQSFADAHLSSSGGFRFLPPLYAKEPVEDAVERLLEAHVVGFSTYVWNERISLAIARELRRARPEVLIVFGGPQVPRRAAGYLSEHPFIDLAVQGEGERAFLAVLQNLESRDFTQVPSASWFDAAGVFRQTALAPRIKDLGEVPSPYLGGVFDPLLSDHPETRFIGTFETNRGCPFACTFCDFGSAVASTVHMRTLQQIQGELEWFAANGIEYVMGADANFGMFPRDVEIAAMCCEVKKRRGNPKIISLESAKNASDRTFRIQKMLQDNEMSMGAVIAVQSLHEPTLEAIKRKNIRLDDYHEVQKRCVGEGIWTMTDLILGLPEETYDSFLEGIGALLDLGQHHKILFNNLCILPNSEMGDPDYLARYEMKLVDARIENAHGEISDRALPEMQKLCVGTRTLTTEDWIRIRAFSWTVGLLHFDKLLQIPLVVLRETTGISYRAMFERFAEIDGERFPVLSRIRRFFLEKARAMTEGDTEYTPNRDRLGVYWPTNEHALLDLYFGGEIDAFYEEAGRALFTLLGERRIAAPTGVLEDAIRLNRALLKLPRQIEDLDLDLDFNLADFHRGVLTARRVPLEHRSVRHHIERAAERSTSDAAWMKEVVWYQNKTGRYLYRVTT
jgi:2-(S-pantetheinyl)-carbapenam-3-carboxylate methyltransferase